MVSGGEYSRDNVGEYHEPRLKLFDPTSVSKVEAANCKLSRPYGLSLYNNFEIMKYAIEVHHMDYKLFCSCVSSCSSTHFNGEWYKTRLSARVSSYTYPHSTVLVTLQLQQEKLIRTNIN